jgi:hypothetical protein
MLKESYALRRINKQLKVAGVNSTDLSIREEFLEAFFVWFEWKLDLIRSVSTFNVDQVFILWDVSRFAEGSSAFCHQLAHTK